MENKLTPELIEKAKQAKSAEELIALAKENGAELSAEEAQKLFDSICDGTLTDDDLEKVSGGRIMRRSYLEMWEWELKRKKRKASNSAEDN